MAESERQRLNRKFPPRKDSPAEVEITCLNREHRDPVTFTVKPGQPRTCPSCGRLN